VSDVLGIILLAANGGIIACLLYALKNMRGQRDNFKTLYRELTAAHIAEKDKMLESWGNRERELIAQLKVATQTSESAFRRLAYANQVSIRLAQVVKQYVKDMDDTAKLLKDENPPEMKEARTALEEHRKLLSTQ
jgi:translation initiation factor IF-2